MFGKFTEHGFHYFSEILAFNDALPQLKEINTTVLGMLPTFHSLARD
jgi:hypothetical protein